MKQHDNGVTRMSTMFALLRTLNAINSQKIQFMTTTIVKGEHHPLNESVKKPSIASTKLDECRAENLDRFSEKLQQSRMWYILPKGKEKPLEALRLFDRQTKLHTPPISDIRKFLENHPFVHLRKQKGRKNLATLQSKTRILWNNSGSDYVYTTLPGKEIVEKLSCAEITDWKLPSESMLKAFASDDSNPYRFSNKHRLARENGVAQNLWLTASGQCNVDEMYWSIDPDGDGSIFACNTHWGHKNDALLLMDLIQRELELVSPKGDVYTPVAVDRKQDSSIERLLASWVVEQCTLRAAPQDTIAIDPRDYWIDVQIADIDYTSCRLPKLDGAQLTDPEKGLWELWGETRQTLNELGYIARDPERDVQSRAVAIDFGTSSTVVAMDTAHGARELLRIGVRDFFEDVQPGHFENPTVLECLDFTTFNTAWTANAYRPALDWNWMRAAHEAQASFRDNPGDTTVLSSILPRLKQWALRSNENRRVRLTDRQGHEMEVPPHTERTPLRGQPLAVSEEDPFDPVELYAWYLGMAINWRGRGLFLKYYLSFPVKYPLDVKERILASFRRGLQRSLPQTLIQHYPDVLQRFEVTGLASEPAAYAAAALPHLGVEPTDVGVPYAVFDFGGGTTDFDYGLLRWATPEEEAQGYERVFEHLASSGDNFLGGENLLEHLVYESFQSNLTVLREKRIQFTQPIDAKSFAGSEAFLANTQAAQTNSVMLAAKLRDFLELDKPNLQPQVKFELIDVNGSKQSCELTLDSGALDRLLDSRIRKGVEAFLAGLARLLPKLPTGAPIQILLAGNGSRSRYIKELFNTKSDLWREFLVKAFDQKPKSPHLDFRASLDWGEDSDGNVHNIEGHPPFVVHPPLPMDIKQPHALTAKTGVALGLLRLAPGEGTLTKNHLSIANDGQAPFAWFVGRLRRGRFEPVIEPNAAYGKWVELGPLQQGVFNMYTTSSPRAHNGLNEGDTELHKHRQDFPAAPLGSRAYARAIKPHLLELAAAPDESSLAGAVPIKIPLE